VNPTLQILTGAPGTGKTTVLRNLATDVLIVDEPAREVLAERRSSFIGNF
jgi:predicted ATPase